MVGGDGAFCKGGELRTSPSTGAAEMFWWRVYPQQRDPARLPDDALLAELAAATPTASTPRIGDPKALTCSEWDKWHRLVIVVSRATDETPLAEELYQVTAVMDSMFGVNEGTSIFKGVADAFGVQKRSTHLPGATRKHASLQAEPGNFLSNLKTFAVGLHLRKDWKRAGHSGFNLSGLGDVGRRSTSVDLVAFALLHRDVIRQSVVPAANIC